MSDYSRLFLAAILSMGVLYFYNSFFVAPQMEAQNKARLEAQKNQPEKELGADISNSAPISDHPIDVVASMQKLIARNDLIMNQKTLRIKIDSDKILGSINLEGAKFDDVTLKKHKKELAKDSGNVDLLSPQNTKDIYFVRTGFLPAITGLKTPNDKTVWSSTDDVLTESNPVTLSWDNGEGLTFQKEISIDENYLISVKESVFNGSSYPISVAPFGLINQSQDISKQRRYISHEGPIAVVDEVLEEVSYDDLVDDGNVKFEKVSGWAGITTKYWMTAIVPQDPNEEKVNITIKSYEKSSQHRFQVDLLARNIQIAPNSKAEYKFNIYSGAKNLSILDDYESKNNIPLFDHAIDFGWLYFLTRPIFEALTFFHGWIGNFGLAILLLTICIRLILFPIANKSYNSMARMRKHMPEIKRLKERYSKDRQKLGTEMMKYYKEHKINPASGCLPMLVQIPVFFSLYKVLYVTIEMRHAPFYGWIHDLSAPDHTDIFNLFGLIPYSPPEWLPVIGVLPLLFSLTMFLQQKLNPPATDETQKMVMNWLPWIFLFLFASFPAGLVLYWVWNNTLSIIQQYIITKRINGDKNA